jgi:hypothetical protein
MPSRRLEDRIRELCTKVIDADERHFGPILSNLKSALSEHTARLRQFAAAKLTRMPTPRQRRSY